MPPEQQPPAIITPNQQGKRQTPSANASQWEAQAQYNTDTTRTSGDMLSPPACGARYQEELVESQGRTSSHWGGDRRKGGG